MGAQRKGEVNRRQTPLSGRDPRAAMIFVDTNILFYAVDSNDLGKQQRAAEVLLKLAETSSGVISSHRTS